MRQRKPNLRRIALALLGISACLVMGANLNAQERDSRGADNAPKISDIAPFFKLASVDGKSVTELAAFRDSRPVILFFGSYS